MPNEQQQKEKSEAIKMLSLYEKALLNGNIKADDVPYYRARVEYWSKRVDRFDAIDAV